MSQKMTDRYTISVTPQVIKPRSGARRNSTGKATTTVSPFLSDSGEKPVPNYLRTSTGSCHDFCKYGIKQDLEAKKRLRRHVKFLGNSGTPNEKQNQTKVLTPQERRKRQERKSKPSQSIDEHTDEVITEKDLPSDKEIQLSDTPANQGGGSTEESSGTELKTSFPDLFTVASLEHKPGNLAEESSQGFDPIPIKLVTLSDIQGNNMPDEHTFPAEGLCEEPVRIKPDESCAHKGIVSAEHTPVALVDELEVEHLGTKLVFSPPIKAGIAFAEHVVSSIVEESSEEPEIIKLPVQEIIASAEHAPTNQAEGLSEEQSQLKILNADDSKKSKVNQPKTAQKVRMSVREKVIKQKSTDASIKNNAASPATKAFTSAKPRNTEQKIPSADKAIAPLAHRIIKQKTPLPHKAGDVSAEPATSLKHKESASPSASTGRRNPEKKIIKNSGQSKIGEEKVLKPLKTSTLTKPPVNQISTMKLRKCKGMKPSSPVKIQGKDGKGDSSDEKIKEKTLYTVDPKPGKVDQKTTIEEKPIKARSYPSSHFSSLASSLLSSPSLSSHNSALSKVTISASDKGGTEQRSKAAVSKGENKRILSRTRNVHSEVKSPGPHKLKFRRGKIVNLQSENNSPRRLRFRPAKARTRNQNVQDKKGTQVLFNHVIEETASKLVETRKSKVKALVGAFETVISIQENKPARPVAVS